MAANKTNVMKLSMNSFYFLPFHLVLFTTLSSITQSSILANFWDEIIQEGWQTETPISVHFTGCTPLSI